MRSEIIICPKCKKSYGLEYIKYPCKMEEGRIWHTHYYCPYCKDAIEISLPSDEDVKTYETPNI